ncbi:DoxX-like family protein [Aquimarina amphilecti]|uniref:DoxX-like family protein n=1 Tax=Aquimarina amphilecti TaxID=1038014 RepID=A0A1H7UA48_AQUAM|nr:hypothetical protein [Aquimarina amphilecti]SEL93679.1 DoxX-like family protein [Aquimarina amphilecti]
MKSKIFYYIELAARWYVFVLITIYGSGKLLGGQFYRRGNLPDEISNIPLVEVEGFDLAWTFMGYSYSYILFIGVSQLLGALLLLFGKTKLLGVFILIPILLNIIVFDAVFFDTYGAMASAVLYFCLLLLVLFLNKDKIAKVVSVIMDFKSNAEGKSRINRLKIVGYVFLLMVLFFGIDQLFVNLLGH